MNEQHVRLQQRLQWDNEEPHEAELVTEELRELRRQFWARVVPPIYGAGVVSCPPAGGLSWNLSSLH